MFAEYFRAILHRYKVWLIHRRTARIVAEINALTAKINKAKQQKRGRLALELKRQRLANERLSIELRTMRLF